MTHLPAIALAACLAYGAGPESTSGPARAPATGARRESGAPGLPRTAANGKAVPPQTEPSIERAGGRLDAARLLEAMQRRLPGARIEILDFSRQPVPEGELDFSLAGLRQTPAGEFWTGAVHYARARSFPMWAKVRVRADVPRVIALEELRPGSAIRAGQVRVEMRTEFPCGEVFATSPEEAVGMLARVTVSAGAPLRTAWLAAAPDIARGDMVKIEAAAGGVRVALEAEAQASGSRRQTIPFRNPATGRRFYAHVEGPGRASVK